MCYRKVVNLIHSTDQELVTLTLKDQQVFGLLVERYEKKLVRYIARLGVGDPDTIKDILQESFIKAYLNLNGYDSAQSFSAWMYRIVHNETVSHFRSLKNRPRPIEREEDLEVFAQIADELDIAYEADKVLLQASIQQAVEKLEPKYKDVIILRFFEEKSYDEISDILELPQGTVATYLNRAKARLRQTLENTHLNNL